MKKVIGFQILMIFTLLTGLNAQYLKVSDNQRFLVKDDGTPFFWMGDTGWQLFHRLHAGEAEHYLRNRAAKGFTVIQAVLLAEAGGLSVPTPDGFLPLIDNDPAKPNEDYFKLVDKIVAMAADFGLYMAILPTWGSHVEDKHHPLFENYHIFTPENALQYGEFLGNRYKDNWNVVWIAGGDRKPDGHEQIWLNLINGLRKGSENRQLISYHTQGEHSITENPEMADKLDFYAIQSGHGFRAIPNFKMLQDVYLFEPVKPVIDLEPVYEEMPFAFTPVNGFATDYDVRRAMYWSIFAGGFGVSYGHNSVWQIYKEGYEPILWPQKTWVEALDAPGSFQVGHLRNLMLSRPFLTRIPDDGLIESANFALADYKICTRDGTAGKKDATYIMAYFPIVGGFNIKTDVIPSKRIKAWYFDPRAGLAYYIGEFDNTGSFSPSWSARIRQTMGGPDWVIVVDDASKNYPPPGD